LYKNRRTYGIRNPRTGRNKRRTFASSISGKNTGINGASGRMYFGFQGDRKTAMSLVGTGSPTSKTLKKRCSGASRHISRSGLSVSSTEREVTAEERERPAAQFGLQSGGREGEGGVGKCSRHHRETTLSFCVVAIFSCHLKTKATNFATSTS